ncbi:MULTISPECIES: indolepyruvate oxidoreductase subunit beta [unclassified Dehalobacter]|uniref:indolepyruvate oxidoreductase subunit beta n=1 Tax=unclassified Dehalobacter TaxID=2635733 RepID=UPI000E6D5925|nr:MULTISPECIES: indolepyruvate oxidoreductase subunit beta [unclassified Dehalobacter]RJE47981.1 pyruvate ferredoxin oxidoreductase [Dehalobacter sp. MCB1]TCX50611.1 pyruvate ferredoxin oxidoreductase [Dehalobacter sp. 14DCB1]TCX52145.1 pyruvate ferredoxin oxidoreductase [Dehalobacter sp. 12DCB1]
MNIILAGVGGQGIVLASKVIAQSAMQKGLKVRTAETIGMAQRGGCVVSHVRIGENIHAPLVALKTADLVIGFEPAEAVRALPFLKPQGTVIVSQKAIKPVTASLSAEGYEGKTMLDYLQNSVSRLYIVDSDAVCSVCGSSKVLNTALLGAATGSGVLGFTLTEIETALESVLPAKLLDMNIQALRAGAQNIEEGNICV